MRFFIAARALRAIHSDAQGFHVPCRTLTPVDSGNW
jgi:hypothetical protein